MRLHSKVSALAFASTFAVLGSAVHAGGLDRSYQISASFFRMADMPS